MNGRVSEPWQDDLSELVAYLIVDADGFSIRKPGKALKAVGSIMEFRRKHKDVPISALLRRAGDVVESYEKQGEVA